MEDVFFKVMVPDSMTNLKVLFAVYGARIPTSEALPPIIQLPVLFVTTTVEPDV